MVVGRVREKTKLVIVGLFDLVNHHPEYKIEGSVCNEGGIGGKECEEREM